MKKKLTAEFLGTYFLVFAGCGSAVVDATTKSITHLGVALTFGLVVMAFIYAFGHISGAHFNPAVTIGLLVRGDISAKDSIAYIITQLLAGIAAAYTLLFIFGNVASLGATIPTYSESQSFVVEFISTFALVMVVLGSAVHGKAVKGFAGIAIGGVIGLMVLITGPVTGGSMNPARSLGPALASGAMQHVWIYLTATVLGAIVASLVYRMLHEK